MDNYNNAFTEVYTILQYLDSEEFNKIPKDIVHIIEENRNVEYNYEFNVEEDMNNQKLLPETKAILFNLFRDYLSRPEQKEKIIRVQASERTANELAKQDKYDSDVFKDRRKKQRKQELQVVEYKQSFIRRIWNFIKRKIYG